MEASPDNLRELQRQYAEVMVKLGEKRTEETQTHHAYKVVQNEIKNLEDQKNLVLESIRIEKKIIDAGR